MLNKNQMKREFLTQIVNRYEHVNPSVTYLMNYLIKQPNIMETIVFTDQVKYAPRGIYVSYQYNSAVPFIYYKNQRTYTNYEQAFHDLRLNMMYKKELFYLELNVPQYFQLAYVLDVFEENPFVPEDEDLLKNTNQTLNHLSTQAYIKYITQQLDEALDQHNYEQADYFVNLIEQLKGTDYDL
ncbi:YpiB family protein [Fundicoccus sp. Sow4_H7]|uniref:YpiB family protein n=1 Tax=Fundicoccus sp. Sow4_H7 TaxID=3438784 RepID=UPI003F8F14B3